MTLKDIKEKGYKVFLVLSSGGITGDYRQMIYARHKDKAGTVTVFDYDGIHYIDHIQVVKEVDWKDLIGAKR